MTRPYSSYCLRIRAPKSAPQVTAGNLKAYGVTSKEKLVQLPAVESLVTALGPKFDIIFWQGMFAPAGTPDAVIKTLNAALREAVADPGLRKKWIEEGFDPFPPDQLSPEAAGAFLKSEIARWGQVIRDNNIHVSQQ